MENNAKCYRYVRFDTSFGRGYAVVCYDFVRSNVDGKDRIDYTAGVAFCSPKDRFNKSIGRGRAEARHVGLRKEAKTTHVESFITVPTPVTRFVSNAEFLVMLNDIMAHCNDNESMPRWAVKSSGLLLGLSELNRTVIPVSVG